MKRKRKPNIDPVTGKRPYNRTKGKQPSQPEQPQVQTEHTYVAKTSEDGNLITVKMTTQQRDEWLKHLKAQRDQLQKTMDDYDNNIAILEGN